MTPPSESEGGTKPGKRANVALLVAYAAVVAWALHEQATSWPHEGSWAFVVFLILCPGILFQSFNLGYTWRTGRPLTRRWPARVVTILLGLMLAAALDSWASTLAMASFEQAYSPFVAQVAANPADPCGPAARYFAIPSVAEYNRQAGRERPQAKLKHDGKRFVLSFPGGSIDIDGSTIYYDSGAKAWSKYHNNNDEKSGAFAKLTEGLAECLLRAS